MSFPRVGLFWAWCAWMAAQTPNASISGSVSDTTGAAMPGVKITAADAATGVTFRAETNESGVYNFPSLPAGRYRVSAARDGFESKALNDVALEVGGRLRLNFDLAPGQVNSVVEVSASTEALLATVQSSIGGVVSGQRILNLPVVSRGALGFVSLQAGVYGGNFAGSRIGALNVTIDGINVQDNRINSGVSSTATATIDIIEEFRVVTSPADAEYGRGSGQIQARTRSGTNEFHGAVFHQHRNTVLNANSWFNNQRGRDRDGNIISPRNRLVRNQFGGRLGGPIRKNKTFFHLNYEGTRSASRTPLTATVLTESARQGRFRYFPGVRNGAAESALPTVDLNGNPVRPAAATGELQTINLYQYDAARSRPDSTGAVAKLVALQPAPNNFRSGDGLNTAGYTWSRPSGFSANLGRAKLDHYFTSNHRMDIGWQREDDVTPNGFQAPNYPGAQGGQTASWTHFLSAGLDSTLSARMLNQFRMGFNRPFVRFYSPWEVGGPDVLPQQGGQGYLPLFLTFSQPIPDQDPQGRISPVYQISDSVSYSAGKHTYKTGFELRFTSSNGFNSFDVVPRANIGAGVLPATPVSTISGIGQNSGLAVNLLNDLTGTLANKTQAFNATGGANPGFVPGEPRQRTWRQREFSMFFKDDWKVTSRLTLNLGARWEYYGVPYEALGRLAAGTRGSASIFGVSGSDFSALFRPGATGGALTEYELVGRNSPNPGRSIVRPDRNNFAPAVGFAYQIPGLRETVFRAGYGTGYERNSIRNLDVYAADLPGLRVTNNFRSSAALNLANMPVLGPTGRPLGVVPLTDRGQTTYAWDTGLVTPYTQNWNASVTRRLPGRANLDVRYVGSKGTRLYRSTSVNEQNIFENGILDAYLAAQRGGTAPLLDAVFRGLNVAGVGVIDGSAGRTGGDALRALQPGALANNNPSTIASYFNSSTYAGLPGTFLRRAGLPENFVVANPQFGAAYLLGNFSNSTYHSMQVEVLKDFSHGLQLQSNWTWSRTIGDEEGDGQDLVNSFRTNRTRRLDKRLMLFHRTHVFRNNFTYSVPLGHGRRFGAGLHPVLDRIAGGWEIGGIFNMFTGEPLSFYSGRGSFNNFSGDNTADAAAAIDPRSGAVRVGGNGVNYFDGWQVVNDPYRAQVTTTARIRDQSTLFAIADASGNVILRNPAPGTMGNLSDSVFYGPGAFRLDVRLGKRFRISEKREAQVYFDAENATNSPQWGNPNTTINSASFGRITSAGGTRILSVNARINF